MHFCDLSEGARRHDVLFFLFSRYRKAFLAVHKLELLSHLPPTARIGPIDHTTLPAELVQDEDEEEIFRTGMA